MTRDSDKHRITDTVIPIDYRKTFDFFQSRGQAAGANALTATMYQDPDLADRRDRAEKQTALPLLEPTSYDNVLDLGCGTGRWASALSSTVKSYLGIDFSEPLLEIARQRFPKLSFQRMNVAELNADTLPERPRFTLIICSGILAYINDADIESLFAQLSRLAAERSRIYLREPMAKGSRLTLDRFWSDELQTDYSAIYRTRTEYLKFLDRIEGFSVRAEGEPFPQELQNRAETEQRFFLLERQSRR